MKTRINFFIALLSAMMFLGCSIDSQIENETAADDMSTARPVFIDLVFESHGVLEIVEATNCKESGLKQVKMKGPGSFIDIGKFEMAASYCTDFKSERYGNGVLMSEKGSELYFSFKESGVDKLGVWILYHFEGGTKDYEKARGELKVYIREAFKGTLGDYKYYGEGFIWL